VIDAITIIRFVAVAFALFCVSWCLGILVADIQQEWRYARRRKGVPIVKAARVQAETDAELQRLAARMSPAELAASLAGTVASTRGRAVVGASPAGVALDRDSEYGRGTSLVGWMCEP
jgi:hypothetical protein